MKKHIVLACVLACVATSLPIAAQTTTNLIENRVIERGLSHRIWETVSVATNGSSQVITRTNSYIELGNGMHYQDTEGQWHETQAKIRIHNEGFAVADEGPHKVTFAADINTPGGITLVTPDNKTLRSHLVGIAYYDFHKKESCLIGEVKNSIGAVVGENQVLYSDAFTDLKADVRYTYTKDGMEQDVIFRERLPLPESFGFDPRTTWIEVWTEFLEAPLVQREQQIRKGWTKAKVDSILDFGIMKIGPGAAFGMGNAIDKRQGIPVRKHWMELEGRKFLVEEVSFSMAKPKMRALPEAQQAALPRNPDRLIGRLSKERLWPEQKVAKAKGPEKIEVASVSPVQSGFVIDYSILTSVSDFTFKGDTTYYVNGTVNLSGATTIEGGAVVKYTNGAVVNIWGTVNCLTDAYNPAVFTAYNDSSVGQSITSGSSPTGVYADVALALANGGDLQHLHFRYANKAVYSEANYSVSHSQFVHCYHALQTEEASVTAENILMFDVGTGFFGKFYNGSATHLTFNGGTNVTADWFFEPEYCGHPASSSLLLTNSLITGVTSLGVVPVYAESSQILASSAGIYQEVGAASHYLTDESVYRNFGTTEIRSALAEVLAEKTTYPPLVLTNQILSNDLTLGRQVQRDMDQPDLGYHYAPLDFVFSNVTISNATLVLTNDVAVGLYGNTGLKIVGSGKLTARGGASDLIRIAVYNTVQEQANTNWISPNGSSIVSIPPSASLDFDFVSISRVAGGGNFFTMKNVSELPSASFAFRNSQFCNASIYAEAVSVSFTNCAFARAGFVFVHDGTVENMMALFNNSFLGGALNLQLGEEVIAGSIYNNLFDKTGIEKDGYSNLYNDYNAYVTNSARLHDPSGANDVVLANVSFPFVEGSLGRFYHGITNLQNQGSSTADTFGLYHFTAFTNQVKETNSTVDIGFHYVAVNGIGDPEDSDGDGLSDHFEDANGNGIRDSSETDWKDIHSDGDGVSDYLEWLQGRNPLVDDTAADTQNLNRLNVYTPLQ